MSKKACMGGYIFNVNKGRIEKGWNTNFYISIKDPFIKYINHGNQLQSKEHFRKIIQEFSDLL